MTKAESLSTRPSPTATTLAQTPAAASAHSSASSLVLSPALLTVLLLAAYVGLEWLSFLHEHNDLPVTPWNPALGMMFAAIILRGPKMGLVLLGGVFLAQVIVIRSELPWSILVAMSGVIAVSYTVVATLAASRLQLGGHLLGTRDVLILVAAGLAGALAEATQLWLLLLATKHVQPADIASTWLPLIVGDVIGIAVVAPLTLRMVAWLRSPPTATPRALAELLLVIAGILVILWIVVRPPAVLGQSIFYLLFVPVVVSAVRHGIDGACASLALSQLGLVAILHWHGFELSRFTEYQVLMLVLTLTGLIVGGLVSERQAAHDEARSARLRLHELEVQAARTARFNMAGGMAAALAHEINQPMTAARALARSVQELHRAPSRDDGRIERNLSSMIEQIDHAGAVVRRMQNFLRRGEPHFSTLEIAVVLAEAAALIEPMVKARGIHFQLDVPRDLPAVHGDQVQIGQVVINLIKNSIDAVDQDVDGRVMVSARSADAGAWIEIAVRDNGAGIPSEQVDTIFDPLITTRPEGIGLGLSICKMIVQAHGGRIWLASSVPGATEFRFTLPAASTDAA